MSRHWSRLIAAPVAAMAGIVALQPIGSSPAEAATASGYYASSNSDYGRVDANSKTYEYAPALIYRSGKYYYFACVGSGSDVIQVKSATTLSGLDSATFKTILQPEGGETQTCDPAVVRGDDGKFYLHYSNTPNGSTGAGVAVADNIEGPYTKITRNLLGRYTGLNAGEYGRGQTTVAQGPDGQWYMAFTNQIAPYESHSIVILRSPDPSFANTRTEVTRLDPGQVGGYSTQMSFDPQSGRFLFVEPQADGVSIAMYDASFSYLGTETLGTPSGAGVPGEGQALLTDPAGRLRTDTPSAPGHLVVAGATQGPSRNGYPTSVTGANQWRRYAVNPTGAVDAVQPVGGAVHVAGWSYDPNDRGASLETHVYIGQADGSGQVGTSLGTTSVSRPDVNSSQGVTGTHGFDGTVPTSLRGSVQVCIAAINIGSGTNTWLTCQTVTVTG